MKKQPGFGNQLRAHRQSAGLTLTKVEEITEGEFKASCVGAYERGDRAITIDRAIALLEIYNKELVLYITPIRPDHL